MRLDHAQMHVCCYYLKVRFGEQPCRARRKARRVVLRGMKRLAATDPDELSRRLRFFGAYVNRMIAESRLAQARGRRPSFARRSGTPSPAGPR